MRVKRTPIPRNLLWSEGFLSSDQTTWAVQGINRPLAFRTKGISALEFNCFDRRINAPLRLRFSVFPSTRSVGVWITTGHLTLALKWRRLSVLIVDCEGLSVGGFFLVYLQTISDYFQNTGMSRQVARKKKPPLTSPATKASGG